MTPAVTPTRAVAREMVPNLKGERSMTVFQTAKGETVLNAFVTHDGKLITVTTKRVSVVPLKAK